MMEPIKKVEEQALMYMELLEQKRVTEDKLDQMKDFIARTLRETGESKVLVFLNEDENIKVEFAARSTKKFDKEKIAEDLGVEESVVKQDFLIKSVEDGKLTYDKYKEYYYMEHSENINIRKVKVGKKGKKKP